MKPVAPRFQREHGCSEAEWLGWLPEAVHGHALALAGRSARVALPGGHLALAWQPLPPRQIALLRLPRLQVDYAFEAVDDETRARFMKRFDLQMQRGGG